jgi:hypothetical protein
MSSADENLPSIYEPLEGENSFQRVSNDIFSSHFMSDPAVICFRRQGG